MVPLFREDMLGVDVGERAAVINDEAIKTKLDKTFILYLSFQFLAVDRKSVV